jgi:hypothetical protein
MVKLILDDYEALALHALLLEKTNLPTKFRHSPTQGAYRAILDKLNRAEDETQQPKGRRAKNPA